MRKYPTTNIVYSGLEDKGGLTVTILDENKNKWHIWKADYENKEKDSEAYGSLKNYHIGESFGIEYGEKEESFVNNEGKTINFTKRTIYKILPLVANPVQIPPRAVSSNVGHSSASGASLGRNYDQERYEKCAWNYFVTVAEGNLPIFKINLEGGQVWRAFQSIKKDSLERFSPLSEPKATGLLLLREE